MATTEVIPLEQAIVKRIVRRLEQEPGTYVIKTHGSPLGRRGIPDLLLSHYGRFYALEVKRPEVGKVSESQRHELHKIANSGAKVAIVESVDDALDFLGITSP